MLIVFFMVVIINNFRKSVRHQKETLKVIFATQENERQRIAQDLHDNHGAMLSTIRLYIESLSESVSEKEIEELSLKAQNHIDSALSNLKETVHHLVPKNLVHNGWISEIDELIKVIQNNSKIDISLIVEGTKKKYPSLVELNFYRMVQELLNNSLKYAKASKIQITVDFDTPYLSVYYNDNGIGLDMNSFKKGFGFKNMQARVAAYKGFFDMKSEPGKGIFFKLIFEEKYLI
jgi:signal transduction histidine kinase